MMKRIFSLCLIFLLLCGIVRSQEFWMPDANLRRAVNEALGAPADSPFTPTDLLKLHRLDPYRLGVKSLKGLEHAKNLTWFSFAENDVTDLSPLAGLTKLELLYGWSNKQLVDISPLAELTQLRVLNLGVCHIEDISVLANLTQLEELTLYYNEISDIRPLENLTELTLLRINSNYITDITPLKNLNALETLWIQNNSIADVGFLASLTFDVQYDEICEIPQSSILERFESQSKPSIFAWGRVPNRQELSETERLALADLTLRQHDFGMRLAFVNQRWQFTGFLDDAVARRDALLAINPNMIFLYSIAFRIEAPGMHSEDWEHWIRDETGQRIHVASEYYTAHLVDFTHPDVQDMMVKQASAIRKCGLYDGIFLDWWNENSTLLNGYRTYESELRARLTILRGIREAVGEDFLILVNPNRSKPLRSAPYINGLYMESGRDTAFGYTPEGLMEIEETLLWAEEHLREPQLNIVEGWGVIVGPDEKLLNPPVDNKPIQWSRVVYTRPEHPENQRLMRMFTAMSLTHSDGYVKFYNGYYDDERVDPENYWYNFWDAELGEPIGETAESYRSIDGLFIREFDYGWTVYNRSGSEQHIEFKENISGFASGVENKRSHTIEDLDGEIYLKPEPVINPVDLNGDGTVNVLDLIVIANAFGKDTPDVNGDGVVNVLDLIVVANAFE